MTLADKCSSRNRAPLSRNNLHKFLSSHELHAQFSGLFSEPVNALFFVFGVVSVHPFFNIILSEFDHAIYQSGQMMRHGHNGLGCAELTFEAPILCADTGLASFQ